LTRDEQKQITEFVERAVNGAEGVCPAPMDIEADAIIRALFVRNPAAAYRVTMLAIRQARELEAQRTEISETKRQSRLGWLRSLLRKRAQRGRQNFSIVNLRRDAKG
jgi:hypothetical protein